MSHRRARAFVRTAGCVALAGAGALCLGPAARGETFLFRDQARPQVDGKVLAEFDDALFVALDDGTVGFISRVDLARVLGAEGQVHEDPAPGLFARVQTPTPVAAVTDLVGEAWLQPQQVLGDGGLRPQAEAAAVEASPAFVPARGLIRTGEAGLARVALLTGGVAKLGAGSELTVLAADRMALVAGEVLLESSTRPLEVTLGGLTLRVGADARVGLRASRAGSHVLADRGQVELLGTDLRATIPAGQGLELHSSGDGAWRAVADEGNTAGVELSLAGGVEVLAAGQSKSFGSRAAPEGEVWRLLRSTGTVLLGRGGAAPAALAGPELERLVLGQGDVLETAPGATVTLVRVDGAIAGLHEGTRLEVGAALELRRGRLTVETTGAPVSVGGPGGVSRLAMSVTRLTRTAPSVITANGVGTNGHGTNGHGAEGGHGTNGHGTNGHGAEGGHGTNGHGAEGGHGSPAVDELEVAALAGQPELSLGSEALAGLEPGAVGRIRRLEDGRIAFETEAGRVRVVSRNGAAGFDPRWKLALEPGQSILLESQVRAGDGPGAPGPTVHLAGERALHFETDAVEAELRLVEPLPEVVFASGAKARLHEKLWLALARHQELPQLRFKEGPRLTLALPIPLEVHNPTVVLGDPATTLELHGQIEARLQEGGSFSAASLGVRTRDRLELPRGGTAALERFPDTVRLSVGDGRRLWIENGAPPVQARFGDQGGTLFLTMPGAPAMGLPPAQPITVLATDEGEFVVLQGDPLLGDMQGLEPLVGDLPLPPPDPVGRDRLRDLLDVPPFDSPSGP